MNNNIIRTILALMLLLAGAGAATAQVDKQKMASNILAMQKPFSQMDRMALARIERTVDDFADDEDFDMYKSLVSLVVENYDLYKMAVDALDSSFDFNCIVKIRKDLISKLERNDSFTPPQREEMDLLDIYLSRYKGAVENFQDIITQINDDENVVKYRKASKSGRPSAEERKNYIKAISDYVYKDQNKTFDDDITDYINIIPYLKGRFIEYLNFIAANPTGTSPVETEIMKIKL